MTKKVNTYPLSSVQKDIWFDQALHPGVPLYNVGVYVRINGPVDPIRLKKAVCQVVQENEALRTIVHEENPLPLQEFREKVPVEIPFHDLSPKADPRRAAVEWMKQELVKPFTLYGEPLFFFALIKISSDTYWWFIKCHHLIVDGWAISLIVQRAAAVYNNLSGSTYRPQKIRYAYTDFIQDDLEYLEAEEFQHHKHWWRQTFTSIPNALFTDKYRMDSTVNTVDIADICGSTRKTIVLTADFYKRLITAAKEHHSPVFYLFIGLLYCYFSRITGENDIVFGLPILNRSTKKQRQTIGLFVSVSPLRINLSLDITFGELLTFIAVELRQIYSYQQLPISEINKNIHMEKFSRHQLYDIEFSYEKHGRSVYFDGREAEIARLSNGFNPIPLGIYTREFDDIHDVPVDFDFNSGYFNTADIEQVCRHLFFILENIFDNFDAKLRDIEILPPEDKYQLLEVFNSTKADYPEDKTIVDCFEGQAARAGDSVAVVGPKLQITNYKSQTNTSITYRELNKRSDHLAEILREKGVEPDTIVGIMVERSIEMIIGILGILKGGGAYLPIDPECPEERKTYMLNDSNANILLTTGNVSEGIFFKKEIIYLEDYKDKKRIHPSSDQFIIHHSNSLAYIIYTSGSTGQPKGVMIEHRNVVNTLNWFINTYRIDRDTKVLQLSNYVFDPAVEQIFAPLFQGAELFLVSRELAINIEKLYRYIVIEGINIIDSTPTMLDELLGNKPRVKGIRYVISGGEKLENSIKERILGKGYELYNHYGPTETTIEVLTAGCSGVNVTLGKPISNIQCFILDSKNGLLPVGAPGEICISGAGLARGYLNNPQLTTEKCIPHPFKKGEPLYKTGDSGQWLPDGNIEFLGRRDQQVTIRGYRIELGEIEHRLLKHPHIKEAVVTLHDEKTGDKCLCAHVVPHSPTHPLTSSPKLREYLGKFLPDYMIPSYFFQLEKLPLTPNGKIDRNVLSQLAAGERRPASGTEYIPPGNEIEEKLVKIWQDVLSIEKIGINDNFFDVGGHSLKATQVVSRVYKDIAVEVTFRDIFKTPTIAGLARLVKQKKLTEFIDIQIQPVEEQEYYDVSNAQRRLWVINQFEEARISYNIPAAFTFEGPLNIDALNKAFLELIERHESLRTSFITVKGVPKQMVHKKVDFSIQQDVPGNSETLEHLVRQYGTAIFDLSEAPLFKVKLLKIEEQRHIFLFNMHHIISDGWSLDIFFRELSVLYNNGALSLPRIHYKDYAHWQNTHLTSVLTEKQKAYWLEKLSGELPILDFPADYPRPTLKTYNGRSIAHALDNCLTTAIKNICKEEAVTLFMFLLAAVNVLIFRYTGQEDIIIGSPAAGRNQPDLEDQVGFYVNTLAPRSKIKGNDCFATFLQRVKQTAAQAYDNQMYPFDCLVDELNVERDRGRHPLFDVMMVLQNSMQGELEFNKIDVTPIKIQYNSGKFDLTFGFSENNSEILANVEYNTDLFKAERIQRLCLHFAELLKSIIRDSKQKVQTLNILTKEEKHRLLIEFNETRANYPRDKTIVDLFEQQAAGAGDRIAVVSMEHGAWSMGRASHALTYRELNKRANQVAYYLIENHGIQPDDLVGLMVGRSEQMIIGILGILKSGGAYVPIDPDYPRERIKYILSDSDCKVLVTENLHINVAKKISEIPIINLQTIHNDQSSITNDPITHLKSIHLAYVIYTSGSTGQPKGVLIRHWSVVNLVTALNRNIHSKYKKTLKAAFMADYVYDASVQQVFAPISAGHQVFIIDKKSRIETGLLGNFLVKNKIELSGGTPALFSLMIHSLENKPGKHSLKHLIIGGEALPAELLNRFYKNKKNEHVIFTNIYGPTELTVDASYFNCQGNVDFSIVPIGKPLNNIEFYIVNTNNQPQPIGIIGEICIGGAGLARGYLNNPEFTAEKFIPHPFKKGKRLFKTGDSARWLPDGNIEFVGRMDRQVKIRGFRIELGEIEHRLLKHPGIKEAVVTLHATETGDKFLCAYMVPHSLTPLLTHSPKIREYLGKFLPGYMIPSYFIQLEKLPLTSSGKIDRKALDRLAIDGRQLPVSNHYVPPGNETEEKVVKTWQEVLGIEKIGIHDNFFERGGDSIKAIQISSRLYKYGIKLEIGNLFNHPTIKKLAKYVGKIKRKPPQEPITGKVELTPIQKRFFENNVTNPNHFNQAVILYSETGFDQALIEQSFLKIIEHHDALRMVYKISDDRIVQENRGLEGPLFDLEIFETADCQSEKEVEKEANRIQGSINLETGPLVKLALFKTPHGHWLLIVIHHLVIDGVSWRILLDDLRTAYEHLQKGEEVKFQDKTDSFQYWADKQAQYAKSEALNGERKYWKNILESSIQVLPKDKETKIIERKDKHSKTVTLHFTLQQTKQLLEQTNHAYNTEINDLLLTALAISLKKGWGLEKILVNLEGHGREKIVEDVNINRTIGWFTSQFPVLLDPPAEGPYKRNSHCATFKIPVQTRIKKMKIPIRLKYDDLSYWLRYIKETLRKIPNKGINFGILKYLSPHCQEFTSYKNPEISFNYLGEFGQENKEDMWVARFSEPCAGNSVDPDMEPLFALDINAIVIKGTLNLSFRYNRHQYKKRTVEKLANFYKSALLEITAHCAGKQQPQLTPADYGDKHLSLEDLDKINDIFGDKQPIEKIYALSPMQEVFLFHRLLDKESTAFFEQFVLYLEGTIERTILEKSIDILIHRHDILRTAFVYREIKKPRQVVLKERNIEILYRDLSSNKEGAQKNNIVDYKRTDKKKGFDLTQDPLMRFALFKIDKTSWILIWSFHHILMDGWCLGTFFHQLTNIYQSLLKNEAIRLEPAVPYKNYIDWLEKQDREEGLKYWKNYLQGYIQPVDLPGLEPKTQSKTDDYGYPYRLEDYEFVIDENGASILNKIASRSQVTLNTLFQTAWAILLHRTNNTDDVVFGSVVSGRYSQIQGIEKMLGLFINTVPVRIKIGDNQPFTKLIKEVQAQAVHSKPREYLPLAEIQAQSLLKGDLINHAVIFENYPVDEELINISCPDKTGFSINRLEIEDQGNYDLNLYVVPGKKLVIRFSYNSIVYNSEIIKNTAIHLTQIIKEIIKNRDIKVKGIDILTEKEKYLLLKEFNDTKVDSPEDKTIVDLFEAQAARAGERVAVVSMEHTLTYEELNRQSNRLAYLLKEKGIKPGAVVAILVERSVETIVGILAVWKSGSAYLPIDPEYPEERKSYMLNDSKANTLLTTRDLSEGLSFKKEIIYLEDYKDKKRIHHSSDQFITHQSESLAYIIYTSGSTGKPKGAMVEHVGMMNHIDAKINALEITGQSSVAQNASFTFDISVWQFFAALAVGGTTVIYSNHLVLNPKQFILRVIRDNITILEVVPSYLSLILDTLDNKPGFEPRNPGHIRYLVVTGETLPQPLVKRWFSRFSTPMVNAYGPTEASDDITHYFIYEGADIGQIPIGKPIQNTAIYIVDGSMRLCPVGVKGEILVSGVGVGRGYLNNPERTRDVFKTDPFTEKQGIQLYKTGDSGCWKKDGNIEFFGRLDQQVKVRGFRIELGEIEHQLSKYPGIKEAAVTVLEEKTGNKFLCAYVVPHSPTHPFTHSPKLREYLSQSLPDYMVPLYFIRAEKLPLTPNGKIDRRALNRLAKDNNQLTPGLDNYLPPGNETEEKLVKIWQELLGIEKIGINDNFFHLGGHSLKAIQVVSEVFREFKEEYPLTLIFKTPTISRMAEFLRNRHLKNSLKTDDTAALYNNESEKKVFFFPPIIGYHIIYFKLAQMLESYAVYGFNFIEKENRIYEYVHQMIQIQPEGNYILFGYSAGGSLAFEVAAELKRKGKKVSALILLDSMPGIQKIDHTKKEKLDEEKLGFMLKHFQLDAYISDTNLRNKILRKARNYHNYYLHLINKDKIDAHIHLIKLENSNMNGREWENLTTGTFRIYPGFGNHYNMLGSEMLPKNAKILESILENIAN